MIIFCISKKQLGGLSHFQAVYIQVFPPYCHTISLWNCWLTSSPCLMVKHPNMVLFENRLPGYPKIPWFIVIIIIMFPIEGTFSRMRSKGFRFTLGVWGLRVCSLDVAFASATVRARTIWPCLWEVLQRWSFLEVSDVSLLRFAWQAWHFVTFRRVLERVESRFVWQVQYFRDVFTRCLAFFVAAQHFGRVHRHFSWQAQHFRRVVLRVFCKSHWQGCVKWRQGADSVAGVAFCAMCWKLTEASHETSILRLQIFRF